MGRVGNIGRRIELTSMDPHFHDISVGLYEQADSDGSPCFVVHTYCRRDGAQARIGRITESMRVLAGMEPAARGGPALRFPCGAAHRVACRRAFVEACKLDPAETLAARPLRIHDRKSDACVDALSEGGGRYRLVPEDDDANRRKRAVAIAKGLVRLAEMNPDEGHDERVAFPCGQSHDALVGLLLERASNVRAAMREAEELAARGVLTAPSARAG
jgi:hypothetical protein